MIEKLDIKNGGVEDLLNCIKKTNEIIDIIYDMQLAISSLDPDSDWYDGNHIADTSKKVDTSELAYLQKENSDLKDEVKLLQNDHYWYKQQERYKAALVLIRNLKGAGMSYHDMCIESREIAKWALDPDYKPLLVGRYSKDDQELFDTLRETKGGDNE